MFHGGCTKPDRVNPYAPKPRGKKQTTLARRRRALKAWRAKLRREVESQAEAYDNAACRSTT